MKRLVAGDVVLSSSAETSRVLLNLHAATSSSSPMLRIDHEHGHIAMTADHMLKVDGMLQPAAAVEVGSVLEPASKVVRVSTTVHRIINPITASGLILAAGPTGGPVVSTVYSREWSVDISAYAPYSLAGHMASMFPLAVQGFYDEVLEAFFVRAAPHFQAYKAAVPSAVWISSLLACDVGLASGFAVWAACHAAGGATAIALGMVALVRWRRSAEQKGM
jgi:hypothetical protein